jgi:hypothetical protein
MFGKPEGKRQLERTRRRWEDNITVDLKEKVSEVVDRMRLAQDRDKWRSLVNTVMKFGSIKCGEFLDQLSDY